MGHDNDDEKPLLQTMDVMIPFLTQLRVLLANSSTLRPALFPVVEQETPSIHTLPVRKAFSLASTATAATDVHPSTRTCLPIYSQHPLATQRDPGRQPVRHGADFVRSRENHSILSL